ncbi:MAG: class I SAM-dependent methyltransferase [Myxococcota bacterium]|nr:class I SAM-dependent methyltransferase [Myxococcota bacterium]
MSNENDLQSQKEFYASRTHAHLQPREDDAYSTKLVSRLVESAGIRSDARVLEVGAGFGRFTFELLEHCDSVVALDLSESALGVLANARDDRGIAKERCRPLCGDVQSLDLWKEEEPFDHIIGFFILHHLPDYRAAIARLAPGLLPGGHMVFVEPNRRNPLYAAQVACCPDMSWANEKGMFRLSGRSVERAYQEAGLMPQPTRRFGFFPPQVVNRFPSARRFESGIERMRLFEPMLPFLLLSAQASRSTPEGGT